MGRERRITVNERNPMNRKLAKTDKPKRGGARENAGRPKLGKVKMTVHVMPETKVKLGSKPGAAIDALVAKKNKSL